MRLISFNVILIICCASLVSSRGLIKRVSSHYVRGEKYPNDHFFENCLDGGEVYADEADGADDEDDDDLSELSTLSDEDEDDDDEEDQDVSNVPRPIDVKIPPALSFHSGFRKIPMACYPDLITGKKVSGDWLAKKISCESHRTQSSCKMSCPKHCPHGSNERHITKARGFLNKRSTTPKSKKSCGHHARPTKPVTKCPKRTRPTRHTKHVCSCTPTKSKPQYSKRPTCPSKPPKTTPKTSRTTKVCKAPPPTKSVTCTRPTKPHSTSSCKLTVKQTSATKPTCPPSKPPTTKKPCPTAPPTRTTARKVHCEPMKVTTRPKPVTKCAPATNPTKKHTTHPCQQRITKTTTKRATCQPQTTRSQSCGIRTGKPAAASSLRPKQICVIQDSTKAREHSCLRNTAKPLLNSSPDKAHHSKALNLSKSIDRSYLTDSTIDTQKKPEHIADRLTSDPLHPNGYPLHQILEKILQNTSTTVTQGSNTEQFSDSESVQHLNIQNITVLDQLDESIVNDSDTQDLDYQNDHFVDNLISTPPLSDSADFENSSQPETESNDATPFQDHSLLPTTEGSIAQSFNTFDSTSQKTSSFPNDETEIADLDNIVECSTVGNHDWNECESKSRFLNTEVSTEDEIYDLVYST